MNQVFVIDPSQSSVSFTIKHLMISTVKGTFGQFSGELDYDPTDLNNSRVKVAIDVGSLSTSDANRDTHVKGPEFFDTKSYPYITFTSTRFDGELLQGDLSIRGRTRPVSVTLKKLLEEDNGQKLRVSGSSKIKRRDFGLTWNPLIEAGSLLVSDEVALSFDVILKKKSG